jgi:hypothetical protein
MGGIRRCGCLALLPGTIVFIHLGLVPAFFPPGLLASLYIAPRIG